KFGERTVHLRSQRGIHGVMEHVSSFRSNFRKLRVAIAGRCAGERVSCDIKLLEVFVLGLRLLQHAGVLAEVLEILRSLLKKQFERFAPRAVHRLPSTSAGARFRSTEAVRGLR